MRLDGRPFVMRPWTALTIPPVRWINDPDKNPKWFTAASMFAGCGGASTGIKLAGGDVLYINEFIPGAIRTYRANATPNTVCDDRDVRTITGADLLRTMRLRRGELDLLDGSPPCKAYSTAARNGRLGKKADERVLYSEGVWQRVDDLFDNHIRLLHDLQPKIMQIENVMGLAQAANAGVFVEICRKIREAGYEVEVRAIDPTRLGVPQTRVRLVFLGIRRDLFLRGLRHAWPRPYTTPVVTVRDCIPDARSINRGKGEYRDARTPSPTLTVTAGNGDPFSGLSAAPFYIDDDGEHHQYSIPQCKLLFGFPRDFLLGGSYINRYERLARAHAPLAVYNVVGVMMRELRTFLEKRETRR